MHRAISILNRNTVLPNFTFYSPALASSKAFVDYSKVPVLVEKDLQEQFVRGSGPGGQATNTTSNCVVLKHLPTGIVVRCHESRSLDVNRKTARTRMITQLDNHLNGENSVEAQTKREIKRRKLINDERAREKLRLKKEFKEREGLD